MAYTTADFLDNVKSRSAMPTANNTFTTARILTKADDEIRTYIAPLLIRSRGYYLAYDFISTVNSTGIYEVPSRALGSSLVDAALTTGTSRQNITWITEDELTRSDQTPRGIPGIFIKMNLVNLVPATSHGFDNIQLTYDLRPNRLIETSGAAQITGINTGTGVLTFASLPTTFVIAQTFDLIQSKTHFDTLSVDLTATSITSTTVTFSSLPSRLVVGDWLCLSEQSPVVQVPLDLHPLLCQKVASSLLRDGGHLEEYKAQDEELQRMEKATRALYTPRIQKEGKKIANNSGLLRKL